MQKHLVFEGLRRPTVLPEGGAETSFEAKKMQKQEVFLRFFVNNRASKIGRDGAGLGRTWKGRRDARAGAGRDTGKAELV